MPRACGPQVSQRFEDRLSMEAHDVIDRGCVAAAHRDHHRNIFSVAAAKHHLIALQEARGGERKGAKAVSFPGVDAALIDDEVGRECPKGLLKRRLECVDVGRIGGSLGKGHVEAAWRLPEGVVFGAVYRYGEDGCISLKDHCSAVTLVHIAVHNHGAFDEPLRLQGADRNARIIEQAEPASLTGVGMVGSTGEVDSPSVDQSCPSAGERAAHTAPLARNECRGPRKADATSGLGRECALEHSLEVCSRVGMCELAVGDRRCFGKKVRWQDALDHLSEAGILGHGKAMVGGQWQHEVVGGEDVHREGCSLPGAGDQPRRTVRQGLSGPSDAASTRT